MFPGGFPHWGTQVEIPSCLFLRAEVLKSEDDNFVFELFNFGEYYSLDFNSTGTNTNLSFL